MCIVKGFNPYRPLSTDTVLLSYDLSKGMYNLEDKTNKLLTVTLAKHDNIIILGENIPHIYVFITKPFINQFRLKILNYWSIIFILHCSSWF